MGLGEGLVGKLGELPYYGTPPAGELNPLRVGQARQGYQTHQHLCGPGLEAG